MIFIKFFQLILKVNEWRSVSRIYMWILGLKVLGLCSHDKHVLSCQHKKLERFSYDLEKWFR